MIKFTAELDPVPLSRPKVNTQTRTVYYPQRSRNYKKALEIIGRAAMKGKQPLQGKLKVTIDLYRKIKIDSKMFGDVDNHQKAIFDALNEICFEDDSQIIKVICNKHYDETPHLKIKIEEC